MIEPRRHLVETLGTSLLLSAILLAGCDTGRREASLPSAPPPAPAQPAPTPTPAPAPAARSLNGMRAGDLIGRSVYNRNSEKVGVIDDVVVHRRDRVTAVVLNVGGFLGFGASKAVVPVRQLRLEGERIVGPNLTRETMEKIANYHPRDWDSVDSARPIGTATR